MKKLFNIIGHVYLALVIALAIWFLVSWGEIAHKNKAPDPQYSDYNIFMIMKELKK